MKRERKRKPIPFKEGRDQIQTYVITVKSIVWSKPFGLGVSDAAKGLPYRQDYERWKVSDQWNYERGRIFGTMTKGSIPIKNGKQVNREAIIAFVKMSKQKELL